VIGSSGYHHLSEYILLW